MNPDDKRLLLKTVELSQENNRLLKKLDRMYRLTRAIRVTYWVLIIAITLGAYYFIQPYVDGARAAYTSVISDVDNIKAIREMLFKKSVVAE
jgi:hypothetical protein